MQYFPAPILYKVLGNSVFYKSTDINDKIHWLLLPVELLLMEYDERVKYFKKESL